MVHMHHMRKVVKYCAFGSIKAIDQLHLGIIVFYICVIIIYYFHNSLIGVVIY